ncbi:MAG: acyltransferase family protein [Paludibacteraceae bacterium]|nr:acyltransferase family protein [Paludibacteraceae bacterium]
MERKRIDYIDIAKGLGMLAIIWGHIMLYGWSCKMVYGFHIPVFFMLSGMCFNQKKYDNVGELIVRRVKTLLVPYVIFSTVTWLVYVVGVWVLHYDTMTNCWYYMLQTVLAQGSDGYLRHNVALWFVTCLFVVDVLYYFISKFSDIVILVVSVLCAVVGVLLSKHYYNITTLPWSFDTALVAIPLFAFGNLMVKRLSHETIMKMVNNNIFSSVLVTAFFTVVFLIGVQHYDYISMGHNNLGHHAWKFYLNAFSGSISVILISLLLSSLLNKDWTRSPILYIRWLGVNSFYVMATHLPILSILLMIVAKIFHANTGRELCENVWIALEIFVASLIVTSIVIQLINKGKEMLVMKKT